MECTHQGALNRSLASGRGGTTRVARCNSWHPCHEFGYPTGQHPRAQKTYSSTTWEIRWETCAHAPFNLHLAQLEGPVTLETHAQLEGPAVSALTFMAVSPSDDPPLRASQIPADPRWCDDDASGGTDVIRELESFFKLGKVATGAWVGTWWAHEILYQWHASVQYQSGPHLNHDSTNFRRCPR